MYELATNPRRFFDRIDGGIRLPAVFVIATALGGQALRILVVGNLLTMEFEPALVVGVVQGVVIGLIATLGVWILITAYFHFVAQLAFGAEGDPRKLVGVVAWGYMPQAIGAVVVVLAGVWALGVVPTPETVTLRTAAQYLVYIRSHPVHAVASQVFILFLLWSQFLWVFGLVATRDLSVKRAALLVAPLTLLAVGSRALAIANMIGLL